MNTCQVDGLVVQRPQTTPSAPGHPGHQTWQCVISSCGVSSRTMFTFHRIQKHCQNCERTSTPQSGTSHKTCLGGFGRNGSIVWTSAVSHMGRTSNAFKVTMKLQTFLFQMVVTSCISVQYLWKYGFVKPSDNLYAPCTFKPMKIVRPHGCLLTWSKVDTSWRKHGSRHDLFFRTLSCAVCFKT